MTRHTQEKGQTLVIVALTITVLMLMAGLALDVGMAYNDRRDMQNAADAAALAGAQRLCDNFSESDARAAATSVGLLNGATTLTPTTTLSESARRVHAVASTDAETFFFRLVGINSVPVSAEATAECSCSSALAGAWPILFDEPTWTGTLGCEEPDGSWRDPAKSPVALIWADGNSDTYLGQDLCLMCNCVPITAETGITSTMAFGGNPMTSGNRGWAQLDTPPAFDDIEPWAGQNCVGADTLKTWMEYGYPGLVEAGSCVPTESGTVDSALSAALASGFEDVSILLYDPDPETACTSDDIVGECDGDLLKVAGTGAVRVERIYSSGDALSLKGFDNKDCTVGGQKIKNRKGILVTALCDPSPSGGNAGGSYSTTCVPAVSLVD